MAPLKIGFNARELKQHGVLERMKAGKLNQLEAAGKLSLRRHQLMAAWDEARMKRPAYGLFSEQPPPTGNTACGSKSRR